jgi:polygalacturonase
LTAKGSAASLASRRKSNPRSLVALNADDATLAAAASAAERQPKAEDIFSCIKAAALTCYRSIIFGRNISNLVIRGPTSAVIDGQGAMWQPLRPTLPHQAPKMLELVDAINVTVLGLTFLNSANWHVHLVFANNIKMINNTVLGNRSWGGTDGIDPHGSTDVIIEGAYIDVGDDAIAVTSGQHDITGILCPAKRVRVVNSYLRSRNFAIGSGTFANVSDVVVEDTRIGDDEGSAPWAIKIKTHCPYGGVVSNITFQRLRLGAISPNTYQQPDGGYAIAIYENYGGGCGKDTTTQLGVSPYALTAIHNITFKDIRGTSAVWAGNPLEGVEFPGGANVTNLHFENISFGVVSSAQPWVCRGVVNTTVKGVVQPPLPASCGI